jgi:hypothetical protein
MSEKLQDNKEQQEIFSETPETQQQRERLQENREKESNKLESHDDTENARHEIEQATQDKERQEKRTAKHELKKDRPVRGDKASRELVFKKTMKDTRSEMSAPSRAFSKVIHNKAVEKTSEAIGDTLARPNVLLAGSLSALLITTAIYLWARYVGYPLSGFETIAAFIIGYLIGIIFDFTRVMITGKR